MLAALLTSFGVPMLLGGDELGRTQRGNNNAYCQDNEISWYDWSDVDHELLAFTTRLLRVRRHHPVLRRRRFLTGVEAHEVGWYEPSGAAMTDASWNDPEARAVAVHLDGRHDPDLAEDGTPLLDDDLLLCVNAWWEPLEFTVPVIDADPSWTVLLETADPGVGETAEPSRPGPVLTSGSRVVVAGRSLVVLRGAR
jgi:glycogen operon protein